MLKREKERVISTQTVYLQIWGSEAGRQPPLASPHLPGPAGHRTLSFGPGPLLCGGCCWFCCSTSSLCYFCYMLTVTGKGESELLFVSASSVGSSLAFWPQKGKQYYLEIKQQWKCLKTQTQELQSELSYIPCITFINIKDLLIFLPAPGSFCNMDKIGQSLFCSSCSMRNCVMN